MAHVRGMTHTHLLRVAQAAAYLGVHPQTLRRYERSGRLACVTVNQRGDRRFSAAALDALLAQQRPHEPSSKAAAAAGCQRGLDVEGSR